MRRSPTALAVALTLWTVALGPGAGLAAAEGKPLPEPDYPEHLLDLMPGFIADAEALARPADKERPWWPQVQEWLDNASNASEADRFRIVLFDLETFTELLFAKQLIDEAQALPNDAERKTFVIQRTSAWKQDADAAWSRYREKLHSYDGQLQSLHTVEAALYSADLALTSALSAASHTALAREFPAEPGFDEGYVVGLVRYSHTPFLRLQWADAVLQAAADLEGTGPRIREDAWANLTAQALAINGTGPAHVAELRTLGDPVRANGEGTLALAVALAEQRSARLSEIQLLYGDAQTRLDVLSDAAKFLGRRLENLTLESPRSIGLHGSFTSDAADRAHYALEFHERGQSSLGLLLATWANMDHADYVVAALGSVSPVTPPPTPEDDGRGAPLAPWLALLGLATVALALRRRG